MIEHGNTHNQGGKILKMIDVMPIDDIEEHIPGTTCWCFPRWEEYKGEIIVIHNAFDGRTLKEENDVNP